MVQIQSTSATYLFCDAALLGLLPNPAPCRRPTRSSDRFRWCRTQPWGLYQALTHFRHANVANMAFLDGHVEAVILTYPPSDPSWPADAGGYMRKNNLGFPTDNSSPYTGNGS